MQDTPVLRDIQIEKIKSRLSGVLFLQGDYKCMITPIKVVIGVFFELCNSMHIYRCSSV